MKADIKPTYKSNLSPETVAKISAAIILLLVALCFASCSAKITCPANDHNWGYKSNYTKPFKH